MNLAVAVLKKSTHRIELWAKLAFFFPMKHRSNFKEPVIHELRWFRCRGWQTCSQRTEVSCRFVKSNWQCLLPMTEFKLSSENQNFGKHVSFTVSLIAYQHLKILLARLVINKCDFFFFCSCDEMCQYLGNLQDSRSHNLPDDQCTMLQNQVWGTIRSKCETSQHTFM